MEYETGKFKRDTVNRKGKETKTVRVTGLSVNSMFKDNDELIIMTKEEFTKYETQVNNSTEIIENLENQLQEARLKLDTLENVKTDPVTDNPKHTSKIIELQDEISTLKDTINNRNILLGNTQTSMELLLNEITLQLTKLYDTEITKANTETVSNIKTIFDLIKETYSNLFDYLEELENQQTQHNTNIDNSNFITRAFSKDSFKLNLDTSKIKGLEDNLKKINQYCIDYKGLVKPIEIPASKIITEIKLNAKSNKFDIKELYIDTGKPDDNEENITITPEAVDNGN